MRRTTSSTFSRSTRLRVIRFMVAAPDSGARRISSQPDCRILRSSSRSSPSLRVPAVVFQVTFKPRSMISSHRRATHFALMTRVRSWKWKSLAP